MTATGRKPTSRDALSYTHPPALHSPVESPAGGGSGFLIVGRRAPRHGERQMLAAAVTVDRPSRGIDSFARRTLASEECEVTPARSGQAKAKKHPRGRELRELRVGPARENHVAGAYFVYLFIFAADGAGSQAVACGALLPPRIAPLLGPGRRAAARGAVRFGRIADRLDRDVGVAVVGLAERGIEAGNSPTPAGDGVGAQRHRAWRATTVAGAKLPKLIARSTASRRGSTTMRVTNPSALRRAA